MHCHYAVFTCRRFKYDYPDMIFNQEYIVYDDTSNLTRNIFSFDGMEDVLNGHRAEFVELAEYIVHKDSDEYDKEGSVCTSNIY